VRLLKDVEEVAKKICDKFGIEQDGKSENNDPTENSHPIFITNPTIDMDSWLKSYADPAERCKYSGNDDAKNLNEIHGESSGGYTQTVYISVM